jgi:hypothetical protein
MWRHVVKNRAEWSAVVEQKISMKGTEFLIQLKKCKLAIKALVSRI